jgi:hypothetical protein
MNPLPNHAWSGGSVKALEAECLESIDSQGRVRKRQHKFWRTRILTPVFDPIVNETSTRAVVGRLAWEEIYENGRMKPALLLFFVWSCLQNFLIFVSTCFSLVGNLAYNACCDVAVAQINYPNFKHNTQDSIKQARGRSHKKVQVRFLC